MDDLPPLLVARLLDLAEVEDVVDTALGGRVALVPLEDPPMSTGPHAVVVHAPGLPEPIVLSAIPAGEAADGLYPLKVQPIDDKQANKLRAFREARRKKYTTKPRLPAVNPPPRSNRPRPRASSKPPRTVPDARADPLLGFGLAAGKYEIEAPLGVGAYGKVYRARHKPLNKPVAVKVLQGFMERDHAFAERFQREALAASKLDHPNVAQVLDYGEEPDGLLYIVMELIPGKNLREILHEQKTLALSRMVDIMSQVCAALGAAHEHGVVHRDVKPENVILTQKRNDDGELVDVAKVCDFGVASIQPRGSDAGAKAISSGGTVSGTPEYMSPEQARGEKVDARSDIYSCGVMLFEMATGEVPFSAKAPVSILLAHVSDPPRPPRLLNPRLDRRLDAVILKALEKEPGLRHQSARELRADLRRIVFATSGSSSQRKAVRKSDIPIPREDSEGDDEPTLEKKKKTVVPPDEEKTLEQKRSAPLAPRAEEEMVIERTLERKGPQPSFEDLAQGVWGGSAERTRSAEPQLGAIPDLEPVRHAPTARPEPVEQKRLEGTTTTFETLDELPPAESVGIAPLVESAPPKIEAGPPPPPITDASVGFADLLTAVTGAIARTTYYERAHPEFGRSLALLLNAITKPLERRGELSFARRDGHTSELAVMTGAGESMELVKAVPGGIGVSCAQRLGDVFARRGLVSLTFKEGANEHELADAVELLSGPECSSKELQAQFTLRGLTKVSILFANEMIGRERRLPWQVMLAISRIARDIASVPKILKGADPEKKRRLRTALISDVTRALRTPEQVRLLLTSWDLIAAELGEGAEIQGLEVPQALVASLAHPMLLRVASLLLSELEAGATAEAPVGGILPAPPQIVRELMHVIGNRFIKERTIESDEVLKELHTRAVLSFPELPEDLQLWILAEQQAEIIAKDPEQVLRVLDSVYEVPRYAREAATLARAMRVLARRGEALALFTVVVRLQQRHARGATPGDDTREAIAAKTLAQLADTETLGNVARVLLAGRGTLRDPAQGILASFGEVGARALCQVRAEGSDVVRIRFVEAIKEIGRPALPALIEMLETIKPSDDPAMAEDVLRALPEIEDEHTGGLVSKLLQHRAASVRRAAANALAGPWGPLARVALLSALDDSDDRVRVAALTGLRKVTTIDLEIVRRVEKILGAPGTASDNVYAVAASLLGEAVNDAREEAISALTEAIQARPRGVVARLTGGPSTSFESPFVVETLARALLQIGGERGRDAVKKRAEKSRGALKSKLSALLEGN